MINNEKDGEMVVYGGVFEWMGYGSNITPEEVADSYNVSIGLGTIGMFYLIGLGTVLVSTIVPNVYILRLNPKKIMM